MHRGLAVVAIVALSGLVVLAVIAGCGGHSAQAPAAPGVGTAGYAGSKVCGTCHKAEMRDMLASGHPYKLNKVEGGQPPVYPFSVVPSPPSGYSWNDVTYVIGGYGWKARWIDRQGFIVTGDTVQYNLATGAFSAYHADDPPGTKPYDCGRCHTTGWVETGPQGPHQDGLKGMYGTFSEGGITCEACHGPGSRHAQTTSVSDIRINRSSQQCGQCHTRDSQRRVEAKDGFIRHHEQFDEMIAAKHARLLCIDCHHAHKGSRYSSDGIRRRCESCHSAQKRTTKHPALADCEDCHMPQASKSATKLNEHVGDVKTHIFKINANGVDKSAMWYEADGKTFSKGFVTLDFACYSCHTDANGVGGGGSQRTLAELSAYAKGMHR